MFILEKKLEVKEQNMKEKLGTQFDSVSSKRELYDVFYIFDIIYALHMSSYFVKRITISNIIPIINVVSIANRVYLII